MSVNLGPAFLQLTRPFTLHIHAHNERNPSPVSFSLVLLLPDFLDEERYSQKSFDIYQQSTVTLCVFDDDDNNDDYDDKYCGRPVETCLDCE